MLRTYWARVRINGGTYRVSVEARDTLEARKLLEVKYGPVVSTPQRE